MVLNAIQTYLNQLLKNIDDYLINEIENKVLEENIKEIQINFTNSVITAWDNYQQGTITVEIKALPLQMYLFAKEELPILIDKPEKFIQIRSNLLLFERLMEHILKPKEIAI